MLPSMAPYSCTPLMEVCSQVCELYKTPSLYSPGNHLLHSWQVLLTGPQGQS